jgi:hypothetical protein
LYLSFERRITIRLLFLPPTHMLQTGASSKASTSTTVCTQLENMPQNYRLPNATTAVNTAIEQLNAGINNDAENAGRTTMEQGIANTQANQNATIATAHTKTGITNAPHEPPSSVG